MNTPVRVFIALGSNISPRASRLAHARAMLSKVSVGGWKQSPIYETDPIGPQGQGQYLNQVVSFWCTLKPVRLLHILKGIELLQGRKPRQRWDSREIDLDLLYFGNDIRTEAFILPHPQLHLRQFVLRPLCDIDPDWMDPLRAVSTQQLLDDLQTREPPMVLRTVKSEACDAS